MLFIVYLEEFMKVFTYINQVQAFLLIQNFVYTKIRISFDENFFLDYESLNKLFSWNKVVLKQFER